MFVRLLTSFSLAALLAACNGTSGENGSDPFTSNTTPTITLEVRDSDCSEVDTPSFTAGESICLHAEVTLNGDAQENVNVSFSAGLGTVAQSTKLTDSSGIAQVLVNSQTTDSGANSATATYDTVSATANYEFVSLTSSSPELTLEIGNKDCVISTVASFNAGENICAVATLTSSGSPIAGEIITFTAPMGTLASDSKLTDTNGQARVLITSTSSDVGANTATASYATTLEASANYEFLATDTPLSAIRVDLTMVKDGQPINRFKAGTNVQLRASFLDDDDNPITDEIMEFFVELGTLTSDSALTVNGVAEVTLNTTTADVGAAIATATVNRNGTTFSNSFKYQVLSPDVVSEGVTRLGHFDENGAFVEGVLGSLAPKNDEGVYQISAGATFGVKAALVNEDNQRIGTPTIITFSSTCVIRNEATIDSQAFTINGEASSTFEDINCGGSEGTEDQIIASVQANNETLTATVDLQILPEEVGSIEFISALPTNIVLKGTGGQGNSESSTLTFRVKGAQGNLLPQQKVNFTLDTDVGGIEISPTEAFTNSEGEVSTIVRSGNVPTPVRVTATTESAQGKQIVTQSDLLTINTGLPDQDSFTLALSTVNPEADVFGTQVTVTAQLSDSYNNPVPDGTTVNFITEGGSIDASCITSGGSCAVIWRTSNPRPTNNRATIMAYAIGHESFFDKDGNGIFDESDGEAFDDGVGNGIGRGNSIQDDAGTDYDNDGVLESPYVDRNNNGVFDGPGFIDLPDAWLDEDEDNRFDPGEKLFDFSDDGQFNVGNGLFNGPQCADGSEVCAAAPLNKIHIRKSRVLIMSGSDPVYSITQGGTTVIDNNKAGSYVDLSIARGNTMLFTLTASDDKDQVLPFGTRVSITASGSAAAVLTGQTSYEVQNTVGSSSPDVSGATVTQFILENTLSDADPLEVVITLVIETPSGVITSNSFSITLQ